MIQEEVKVSDFIFIPRPISKALLILEWSLVIIQRLTEKLINSLVGRKISVR